jgi:hypothetical protein
MLRAVPCGCVEHPFRNGQAGHPEHLSRWSCRRPIGENNVVQLGNPNARARAEEGNGRSVVVEQKMLVQGKEPTMDHRPQQIVADVMREVGFCRFVAFGRPRLHAAISPSISRRCFCQSSTTQAAWSSCRSSSSMFGIGHSSARHPTARGSGNRRGGCRRHGPRDAHVPPLRRCGRKYHPMPWRPWCRPRNTGHRIGPHECRIGPGVLRFGPHACTCR